MDIVFDKWIIQSKLDIAFERYADDIVVHCRSKKEAIALHEAIRKRLEDCKLELNQEKSKVVYCRKNQKYQPKSKEAYQRFDFLGYTFKPRMINERGKIRLGFTPGISQKSIVRITQELRKMNIHKWVQLPITRIGEILKLKIRGWINYYTKFRPSDMRKLFKIVHARLTKWIRNKYRRFRGKAWYSAYKYLQSLANRYPNLFEHWQYKEFRP